MQEVQRRTDEIALELAECTNYRSRVMRIAYLSLDRPDLAHAVKCLSDTCRSRHSLSNWADSKRVEIPLQPQVLGERLQQTELARQGHSDSRHRLRWRPGDKKKHYRCSYFLRLTLLKNPEQLADNRKLVLGRS
eukprot:2922137-Amphidinium_carterae.1